VTRVQTGAILAIGVVAALLIVSLIVVSIVFDSYTVSSASMEPAVQSGDAVLVRPGATPGRGDIVVFDLGPTSPGGGGTVVRRVVGVEGDVLEASGGRLRRGGDVVAEPYVSPAASTSEFGRIPVPDDHVFVLGDRRQASADSRYYGPVAVDAIIGEVAYAGAPIERLLLYAAVGASIALGVALFVLRPWRRDGQLTEAAEQPLEQPPAHEARS
jgi:signal peptidase I